MMPVLAPPPPCSIGSALTGADSQSAKVGTDLPGWFRLRGALPGRSSSSVVSQQRLRLFAGSVPSVTKPLGQEPVSPHPVLSFMSANALPIPARFPPPGPPMFDFPRIAS
jgi:hypothetical protein